MSFTNKIVNTYSKSLFQNVYQLESSRKKQDSFILSKVTSTEGNLISPTVATIGEELLLLGALLTSSHKLKEFFKNPTYQEKEKLKIVLTIFPGLSVTIKSFLKVLTERGHLSFLPEISDEYTKIILKLKNSTRVKIIAASPLDENLGDLLLKTLKKVTNSTEIILNVSYNPKLLGGFILEYNSVAIDASILKEFSLFFNEI